MLLENKMNRICAPEPNDKSTWALILWTKDNPNDDKPCPQKIVSLFSNLIEIYI